MQIDHALTAQFISKDATYLQRISILYIHTIFAYFHFFHLLRL